MSMHDWLAYRFTGIGASEVGAILGLSPYKSSVELFYEKLGDVKYTVENMAMFMGKEMEPLLASLWQAWDGTVEGMIENYRNEITVRRCRKINAYVRNPDIPWLFVSLDRIINKGQQGKEGSLELKTIGGWEADKWEAGIPPSHIVQVQTQLRVCEFEFGELATLRDGRDFSVIPFDFLPDVCENIVKLTGDFWNKVVEGRKHMTAIHEGERNFNQKAVNAATEKLIALEPEPDGSDAYTRYLKERYKIAEPGEMEGTLEQLDLAHKESELQEDIKELETERKALQNKLKLGLRDNADKLSFGENGYVSWKADINGTRRFLNKSK